MHADLLDRLNAFTAADRRAALDRLLGGDQGRPPEKAEVNMHMHTFFSYNGEGWSPTRLAWEARQAGLHAAGIVDFDVLAALGEWFETTDRLEVRAAAGFESRVFCDALAEHEVNSPGEPGVVYFMGFGFVRPPPDGTAAAATLAGFLAQAHRRNRDLVARLRRAIPALALDYEKDVLPMTPAGNATERHLVRACHEFGMRKAGGEPAAAAAFWASALDVPAGDIAAKIGNVNGFTDFLRSKLMKKGGPGYVQPSRDTFPPLADVVRFIRACDALPMMAWLDGASSGEKDPRALLDLYMAQGVEAANIIPDRNWNFKDPQVQAQKVAALNAFMQACRDLDLPVNAGTELNRPGCRFVDDFSAAPMEPWRRDFLLGAQVMVGHTRLLRYAGWSYAGAGAVAEFPARRDRNAFFAAAGALPAPDAATRMKLENAGPEAALAVIRASVRAGRWTA